MQPSAQGWVRGYRVLFALVALLAVAFQARQSIFGKGFPPGNFFSYFTVQSNLFAAVVLLWGGIRPVSRRSGPARDLVRGAAVLYLAITGVVYGLLLAGYQEELRTAIPWVGTVLHRIMPLVLVGDWLIDPPTQALTWRGALVWLVYPLVYLAYSLLRAPLVSWYPYPFLDPGRAGGYAGVAAYCLGIALAVLCFTWLIVTVGRHVRVVVS